MTLQKNRKTYYLTLSPNEIQALEAIFDSFADMQSQFELHAYDDSLRLIEKFRKRKKEMD